MVLKHSIWGILEYLFLWEMKAYSLKAKIKREQTTTKIEDDQKSELKLKINLLCGRYVSSYVYNFINQIFFNKSKHTQRTKEKKIRKY